MNCSGKHAAMLRTCLANDWPVAVRAATSAAGAWPPPSRTRRRAGGGTGVDGCGAPLFAVSLPGLARAFAQLVAGSDAGPAAEWPTRCGRIRSWSAATGREASGLMPGVPGLIAKDGAEGVFAAALPDGGAVAVKIDDGAARAADCAVIAGFVTWHERRVLDELAETPVMGGGAPVGGASPARAGQR